MRKRGAVARLFARIPENAAGMIPLHTTRIAWTLGRWVWRKEIVSAEGT